MSVILTDHMLNRYEKGNIQVDVYDKGLVKLTILAPGDTDEEQEQMARDTKEIYGELQSKNPDVKYKVMVDLSKAGIPGSKSREIFIDTLSDRGIVKVAFFGAGTAVRSIVDFIISAAGKGEQVQFFLDEEAAKDWLMAE